MERILTVVFALYARVCPCLFNRRKIVLVASGVGEVDEVHLSDRVGAVGGELRNGGGRLEAVIPCE
jgi:hypothetical protein